MEFRFNFEDESRRLLTKVLLVFIGVNLWTLGYLHSPPSIEVTAFYTLFAAIMLTGIIVYHIESKHQGLYYFTALTTFFLTIAALRAFVGIAGIGTPKSGGQIGPFVINQIWIFGLHIHHYYLGAFLVLTTEINHRLTGKNYLKPFCQGVGLALIMDEFGIILTGATYYTGYSYPAILFVELALLLLFTRRKLSS